jgi:predicted RND superfamily exporter protein
LTKRQRAVLAAAVGIAFAFLAFLESNIEVILSFVFGLCCFFSFMAIPAFIYPPNSGDPKPTPFVPPPKKPMEPSEMEKEIGRLTGKFQVIGLINILIGVLMIIYGFFANPLIFLLGFVEIFLGIYLFH